MSNLLKTSIALLLASCLSMSTAYAKQVKVTIGDGTSTSNRIPYGNYDKNSTTQTIYTQVELGSVAGPITGLAFDVASPSSHTTTSLKIYIGKSNTTTFASASDYRDLSGMTLVYDGAPTLGTSPGWEEIELQTPYQYDGKSNLVIVIGRKASSWNTSLQYTTTNSTNQCLHRGSDYTPEAGDPSNTSVSYSMRNTRPNIQLLIGESHKVTFGNIIYSVEDDYAYVKGYTPSLSGHAEIQSQVTFQGRNYPVTHIENNAFQGCTAITGLTIPNSVTSIGRYAFSRSGIESITLPASVKELGDHAFYRCDNLASLTMADGGLSRIEDFTFCYCRQLTDVQVPQSVRYIGRGAFFECTRLESINIPEGVTRLGCFAFKKCASLKQIAIPSSVDSIEMHTFYFCVNLTEAKLPANLKHIGSSAFANCAELVECKLPSSLKYIGNMAFSSCYKMPTLQLPSSIDYLGMAAFEGCSAIQSVEIPANITRIPFGLFSGCYNLKEVTQPEGLTEIDDCAFSGCAIKSINWPTSLQSVGYIAFSGSSNLKIAVVPNANTYGKRILSGNSPMDKVYCFADIILPDYVFDIDDVYNTTLYVKPSMLESYRTSLWASRFKNILPIGDVNNDGKYDILDIVLATNTINNVELPPFNNFRLTDVDLNGDGRRDLQDLDVLKSLILQGASFTPFVPLPAADPTPEEPFETSDGCEELYTIASFSIDTRIVLDYINEIRFEACIEGVPNPSRSGTFLTEADYVPMHWSTDLERCARVRCSESLYTCGHHSRLNGKITDTVSFNGVSGFENLGWGTYGTVIGSIIGYCNEKYDLVYKTGGEVGHYTNLIDPTHLYIGVAAMGGCSATETSWSDLSAKESYYLPPSGIQKIRLDVKSSYIDLYRVGTTLSLNDQSVKTDTHQDLVIFAHITPYPNSGGYLIVPREGHFEASDPEVASIDEHGRITFLKPGTVTVTGYLDGTEIGTRTFTVSCEHDYYYDPIENNKTTGRCSKCGTEKDVSLPTYLYIYWNNSSSGSNSYSGLPSKNPVGSYLKPWVYDTGATSPYDITLVTNDRPDLLETTETASHIESWLVKGVGVAHVTFTCKYNPSIKRTYTINLTEPEESASTAPIRMTSHTNNSDIIGRPVAVPSISTDEETPEKMVVTQSIVR